MEIQFIPAPAEPPVARIYIATAILGNFKGHRKVEAHLFRNYATDYEYAEMKELGLVGAPDPRMPKALLEGATEEAAIKCILEAFTEQEARDIGDWLNEKYGEQIEKLMIYPMDLPVPLGIGPLNSIPEGKNSGFIRFDRAKDYPFPFELKAYYDLGESRI